MRGPETRLGSASGARVMSNPPPAWLWRRGDRASGTTPWRMSTKGWTALPLPLVRPGHQPGRGV